ncbi:MAG TPA: AmmeMemoRadiSam system protein B, partial [Nocardioidaceae bacterium]
MGQARRAVVAGTFYPAKADELAATVDAALAAASLGQSVAGLAGVIVPHAGYVYSAPVAATAYARLVGLRGRIHRVAILGPSHFVPLEGLAVPTVASFLTPLGAAPVAGDACARL